MPDVSLSNLRRWTRLIAVLKYALGFAVLLAFLPLTGFSWMLGHTLLGGLFLQLDGWGVFWTTFGFFASSWSLMSCVGLLIDSAQVRDDLGASFDDDLRHGYLPERVVAFLSLPVTRGWLRSMTVFALVLTLIVVHFSLAGWRALIPAAMGWLCSYLLMVALTVPAQLVDAEYEVLPRSLLAQRLYNMVDLEVLRRLARSVRRGASWFIGRVLRMRYVLTEGRGPDAGRQVLQTGHFLALMNLVGLTLLLVVIGIAFFPPAPYVLDTQPPAAAYLYLLLTLCVWLVLGLDTHLARLQLSPLLLLLLLFLLRPDADHYFEVRARSLPAESLTPVAVAEASRQPENLVLVASSGGGVLSAGWTTLALRNLVVERPRLADEIRLLSTTSGGSVGAAYYLDGIEQAGGDLAVLSDDERRHVLQEIYCRATSSSLGTVAYGFALVDFWRVFTGRALDSLFHRRWHGVDRAHLQENAWARISAHQWQPREVEETDAGGWGCRAPDATGEPRYLALTQLRDGVREGRLPAAIFSATVMENGHRVMLTPVTFEGEAPRRRARTLDGLLGFEDEQPRQREADLDLWTAARLSATFPYVSPAARARVVEGERRWLPEGRHGLHLLDGGYYDNSGFSSALDWLQPVLEDLLRRARGGEALRRRVLLLELTPFSATDAEKLRPVTGSVASLLGPLIGNLKLRESISSTRNAIELYRFLDSWNRQFEAIGADVCLRAITFRPPAGAEQPLSWHLTPAQIEQQIASWPSLRPDEAPASILQAWTTAETFLDSPKCSAPRD